MGRWDTPEIRFWEKVAKSDGCWEWTAYRNSAGYGRFTVGPGNETNAHRYSWFLHYGPIPGGLWVLHHCDNPPCVRPDHLWLGTTGDNTADMIAKGRARRGVTRGENQSQAKLTEADVRTIRASREPGVELARRYDVSTGLISHVRNRRNWRHVT